MPTKGDNTRRAIICEAKRLFSKRGYATVTMKDVCEACELSRGGLYRYFGSTGEIFSEILNEDRENKGEALLESVHKDMPAPELLKWFFNDRRATLMLGEYRGFSFAVHEFASREPEQRGFLRERYESAKRSLASLFEYGKGRGEFREFDSEAMAATVLLLLDSLEVNAACLSLTEAEINAQLHRLYASIVK